MPGQPTPHNPLHAAARETMQVARETKSPLFEKVAMVTLVTSALMATAVAALQAVHMLRRDGERRDKDRERDRRPAPASPPPKPPAHGTTATAGMPGHGHDGEEGRWSRKEGHAADRQAHARQR